MFVDALSALLESPERGAGHTAGEIAQQPHTWPGTLSLCRRQQGDLRRFVADTRGPVLLAGAGTSDFVGRCLERLLEQRWRRPVRAVASTELLTGMDQWLRPDEPALCISFSRSGDSSEGVAVIEEMMHR